MHAKVRQQSEDAYAGRLVQRNLVALELLRAAAQMMGLRVLLGTAAATVDFEAQRLGVISSHTDVEAQDDSERILEAWDDRLPANRTCINVEAAAELLSTTTESASTWLPTHGAAVSNDATLAYDMLVATDGAFSRVRHTRAAVRLHKGVILCRHSAARCSGMFKVRWRGRAGPRGGCASGPFRIFATSFFPTNSTKHSPAYRLLPTRRTYLDGCARS